MEEKNTASAAGKSAQHFISIPKYLVLTVITCGIFSLYWNYRQMEACNDLVGRQEFKFLTWLLLSIVTCGIYHIYYQYKMGSTIVEIQRKHNTQVFDSLPVVSLLVAVVGLSLVADIIHQAEINKMCS